MSNQVIFQLSILAVLVAYLCVSVWLRHREAWRQHCGAWRQRRAALEREREFRRQWQPTALDSSSLSRQIQRLRHDYIALLHSRPRHAGYRNRLIGAVREAILRTPYFQNARKETLDSAEHKPQNHAFL